MIRLQKGDKLYIYSSAEAQCLITGATILSGIKTPKTLYNYHILANTTRLVYTSFTMFDATEINEIIVSGLGATPTTTVKVFINGTDPLQNQVYQSVVTNSYSIIYNSNGWNNNVFTTPTPGVPFEEGVTKSMSIQAPTGSENVTLFFTEEDITILEIYDVIRGTGVSLDWNIAFGSDRTFQDGTIFGVDRNTSSNSGTSTMVFDITTIPANNWVWLTTSAVSGTVQDFSITIRFT